MGRSGRLSTQLCMGQRLDAQGHHGAGDAQLTGRQTLVLATPGER